MKVKLPKDISGVKFPQVFVIEMNNFDIDLFLPSLFFTILSQGRGKARQANDPENIKGYIGALAQHQALQGFDNSSGRRVLERLVRTTLITTGGVGRASKGEQITSIVPYSLLAHKAGFPRSSRLRGADIFLYQALREKMHGIDDRLQKDIKEVFGRGVIIDKLPELGGRYDNVTELDTLTRLSIAFLDGFQNTHTRLLSREKSIMPACPLLVDELATDLLQYLFGYYKLMPTQAFTYNLLALINFELFNYTLKLVYAINQLVQSPETLPMAMRDSLQRLLLLQQEPSIDMHIQAQARTEEERIREQNELQDEEVGIQENEENLAWLSEIAGAIETDFERVVNLLVEGQRDNAIQHFISWYYGVGGMKKPHGVLRGSSTSRQSWRYAPSSDLLAVLVQVAAARLSQQGIRSIRLQEFFAFLEAHYGILIDRPPDIFKGAEYAAAARDNLRAMLDRLRQMGIFRDLSDDFTAQRLHAPYAGTDMIRTEE